MMVLYRLISKEYPDLIIIMFYPLRFGTTILKNNNSFSQNTAHHDLRHTVRYQLKDKEKGVREHEKQQQENWHVM